MDDFSWWGPIRAMCLLVRCSRMMSPPLCTATTSWIGKPNYICDIISMLGIASFVLMLWNLCKLGGLDSSNFTSSPLCTMIVGCSVMSWALVGRVCGCCIGQVDGI